MPNNKWYVITGGPSTGKTTLMTELEKMGQKVLPEAARTVIDEGVARGKTLEQIRSNEKKFQDKVLNLKIEIERKNDKSSLTFFDRGIHDTLAYCRHYGFEIDNFIKKAIKEANYLKVFLLEPLAKYKKDYARTENEDFAKKIGSLIEDAYTENGIQVIKVPLMPPKKRAKFVLDEVAKDQERVNA